MDVSTLLFIFSTWFFAHAFSEITQNASHRIILGEKIDIEKVPWQVSILYRHGPEFFCGGSIIGPYEVLTAGHCIDHKPIDRIIIRAGSTSIECGGTIHNVESAAVHPQYKCTVSKIEHDLAVVRVTERFRFNRKTQPIKIFNRDPRNGEVVQVAGWGKTVPHFVIDQSDYPRNLRYTKLHVYDKDECYKDFPYPSILALKNDRFCFNNYKFGTYEAVCMGDSGSPVTLNNQLVGVASEVINGEGEDERRIHPNTPCHLISIPDLIEIEKEVVCNDPKSVDVYNSIVQHRKWINMYLENNRTNSK